MAGRTSYTDGTFSWVDLSTRDLEKSKSFYGDVLGWTAVEMPTESGIPYVIFQYEGKSVAAAMPMSEEEAETGNPSHWNHYVTVEDIEVKVALATELGGTVLAPVMDIMDAGRMAVIADPEGAVFCLWEKGKSIGAEWVNHPGGFSWNELATRNVPQATDFYSKLFSWTIKNNEAPDDYFEIRNKEDWLNGAFLPMSEDWPADVPAHWNVYFSVKSIADTIKRVESGGGKIIVPQMDIEVGSFVMFSDPTGACFYAIEQKIVDD